MEIRVLQYFLAVAKEQSIIGAAKSLHLSQPALSTQLKNLEKELGKQLFIRGTKGSKKIILTEEGIILRKRAEEILSLVQKTENEIRMSDKTIMGDVYIGMGESNTIRCIAQTAKSLREDYPDIHYHIRSGNVAFVTEQLDKGLIDFGIVFSQVDSAKYNIIKLPYQNTWGVLLKKDEPLAKKTAITPNDLKDKPLIVPITENDNKFIATWMQQEKLNSIATYNLFYNATLMVEEGLGYAFCFDQMINFKDNMICFRPLSPTMKTEIYLIWKKYQLFSKAANKFFEHLQKVLAQKTDTF